MLNEISEDDFEQEVLDTDTLTIVDFFMPWCIPCAPMAERLEKVSKSYPNVKFYRMNAMKNAALADKLNIKAVPTLLFFKTGNKVNTQVGLAPEDKIKSKIEESLLPGQNLQGTPGARDLRHTIGEIKTEECEECEALESLKTYLERRKGGG